MSREKQGFHVTMEQLNARYPEKDALTRADIADFLGCSVRTVRRNIRFPERRRSIIKADLARQLCI